MNKLNNLKKWGRSSLALLVILLLSQKISYSQNADTLDIIGSNLELSGPRFGLTYSTNGFESKFDKDYKMAPVISQIGWQFEYHYFNTKSGYSGVLESVVLIGGLEQEQLFPTYTGIVGLRTPSGWEFGMGPIIAPTGFSMAFVAGYNMRNENVNFPINLVFIPGKDGAKISLMFGFNIRQK